MAKFRKKPVEIEAVRFTGENIDEVKALMALASPSSEKGHTVIHMPDGDHIVPTGHWILRDKTGMIWPCAPDVFAAAYEPIGVNKHELPADVGKWAVNHIDKFQMIADTAMMQSTAAIIDRVRLILYKEQNDAV